MIVTGMLMRAAGFATMGIAHEPWLLWFSCLLSGLGGTLFDPPRSALVVKLIRPQQRGRFFSLLMMQDSAGAVTQTSLTHGLSLCPLRCPALLPGAAQSRSGL